MASKKKKAKKVDSKEVDNELIALLDDVPDVLQEDENNILPEETRPAVVKPKNQLKLPPKPKPQQDPILEFELETDPEPEPELEVPELLEIEEEPEEPATNELAIPETPSIEEPDLVRPEPVQKVKQADLTTEEENEDQIGIKQLLSKFGVTVENIIQNHKSDRDQLQEAIEFLGNDIREARESGARISPSIIEAWSKLLQTKTEVNSNASKVLDSVAKLISAGKGNELVINIGGVKNTDLDLEELLNQPRYEDEQNV